MSTLKINGAPGTGKTTRTRSLFKDCVDDGTPIKNIMYTTYRREVVEKEREKLSDLLGLPNKDLRRVNTIHGICLSLLYSNGLISKQEGSNPVMGISDYHNFNKEYGYSVNPSKVTLTDTYVGKNDPYLSFMSLMKSTRTSLTDAYKIPNDSGKVAFDSLVTFVKDLEEWKEKNNKIGYEDMIDIVLKEKLCPDCSIQFYDEAQDMTTQLHDVAQMWAKEADRVILAGDPLQTLYPFWGADPEYFIKWEGEDEVLPESRRLPDNVWALASELISDRTPYVTPRIATKKMNGYISAFDNNQLTNWLQTNPKNPNSLVFHLVRTNYQGYEVAKTLASIGIPFTGIPDYAWKQSEIDLYNGIRAICRSLTQTPIKSYAPITAAEFCAVVDAYPEEYTPMGKQSFKDKINSGELKTTVQNISPILIKIIQKTPLDIAEISGLTKLKLEGALNRNLPKMDIREAEKTQIHTIHGAKGMEADTIFLHTAIPNAVKKSMFDKKGIENEAYVWYVAITRTRKNLIFVTYNGKNYPIPGYCS